MAETLREARLILPLFDNHGRDLADAHKRVAEELLLAFGGATEYRGSGVWKSPQGRVLRDHVAIYDVAVPFTGEDAQANAIDKLRTIAHIARALAKQECVYLRLPTGAVEFI